MKRTGAGILIVAALLAAGAGFLTDQLLTSTGAMTFTPSASLGFLLIALGVIVVALAIPIRRATRSPTPSRVDPFRAVRIAVLARASSILGAVAGGFCIGLVVFLLTRPVAPSLGSVGMLLLTVASGAALIAAGLFAEHMCTIRKDDDDEQSRGDGPPAAAAG